MNAFSPTLLFELSEYFHKNLFDNCQFAWEALEKLKSYLTQLNLGSIQGNISNQAYIINREAVSIGRGSVVEPGAYIQGPCWLGENCIVRHGAYIRGNVIAGDRCVLGHDSEFKNTILLNGAHAAHFAYVGDSILGNRVNLGAGTVCANLRLDRRPVTVELDGKRLNTGLKKLGAILGDDCQTGCHSVLNPGTIFGKSALCYPCLNLSGYLPPKSIIKTVS